ncbi:hypothetical protein FD754_022837 [Muntiacus muntjak]|uniref:Ig-like domain-containing protein n=1 Tax=Muntiacus muntjak TaxID=9888 RepID=A0A5N3UVF2_MUNMU|nr:hypothetical protein FD754_022837 [Muntiacus muntjak]
MAWCPLLLTLVALCTGSWAQAVLTQPPSVSASPGQRVTISCSGSSSNIGLLGVSWYQHLPGSAPKTLIYDSNKRPSGVPDRFSGTKSGNTGTLTITSLQAEDEVDYYCAYADLSLINPTISGSLLTFQPPPLPSVLEGPPAAHSQKVSKETENVFHAFPSRISQMQPGAISVPEMVTCPRSPLVWSSYCPWAADTTSHSHLPTACHLSHK